MAKNLPALRAFSIVEWHAGPDRDLTLLRVDKGGASEPVAVSAARLTEPALVCFRAAELEQGAALLAGRVIDGSHFAAVVRPTDESHELSALAAAYDLPAVWENSADRARVAAQVFGRLLAEFQRMPLAILDEIERLLQPTGHPLAEVARAAAAQATRKGFGGGHKSFRALIAESESLPPRVTREPPCDPASPLDVQAVCSIFGPEGAIASRFAAYEQRPEQVRMVREVCESFNDDLVLLVEAGTGTGKSLAYLVPSVMWAVRNRDPVVISTNTKNLQSQLFTRDLPFLERALGGTFRYALIKGRANYLCLRKLMTLLAEADRELTHDERLALLPVIPWAAATRTGDVAENSGLKNGMQSDLWPRLSTQRDECLGPRCRSWRNCFVRKARARSLQADVVVANHATVFAEIGETSVVLPPYSRIIFDEAHNLEDVATDALTVVVAPWVIARALNRLYRAQRDGAGGGQLSRLRFQLSKAALPDPLREELSAAISRAIDAFRPIRERSDEFFALVKGLFVGPASREERIRYDADNRPDDWPQLARAAGELKDPLEELGVELERIKTAIVAFADKTGPDADDLGDIATEVGSQAQKLVEIVQHINIVIKSENESNVYWVQQGSGYNDAALYAAPLDIAALMEETIFSKVRTAVFASATLTAGGRFDFIRDRLGVRGTVSSRAREVDLGTSFDFARQAFLAVPMTLPEPRMGGPDFNEPFARVAGEVLLASRGRGLVLFTSHASLRDADRRLRPLLTAHGIRVLAQGVDGERARLISIFAKDTSSVLLGTQSFWEGVDVPGESLSCLIVAKLPFRSHTDPLVAARCDLLKRTGGNEFFDYMVPDAVIRLKQGFGRLIRTRDDRGVVVLCDPRVMTKGYGRVFRDSLPVPVKVFTDEGKLAAAVRTFLDGSP